MSGAISGVSGGSWGMQRPDASKMVNNLFSKIDTKNQGYIDKAELQSAIDNISADSTSATSASVEEIFKKLDSTGDGKITIQEMTDGFKKLSEQMDNQFNQSRMSMGAGGMPAIDDGSGFSKDQLTAMANDIGSKNSEMSNRITNLVNNFDKADTNADGKIAREESKAFDDSSKSSTNASTNSSTSSSASAVGGAHRPPPPGGMPPPGGGESKDSSSSTNTTTSTTYAAADTNQDGTVSFQELVAYADKSSTDASSSGKTDNGADSVMKMMMRLMQAYGGADQEGAQPSSISVTA